MKIFSVIFTIYILTLSCLPCGDTEDCKVLDIGKETFSQTDHHNHQQDTESCSPFCICACCGLNIAFNFQGSVSMTEHTTSFFPLTERVIVENDSFASNYYGSIWQPPKI